MKGMIVRFDFSGAGPSALADWRRFVTEESVPKFERHAGLRQKIFYWDESPPTAVAVYLFAEEASFWAYARPLIDGVSEFTTSKRFGVPAHIQVLDVAGVADGPGSGA